MYDDYNYNNYYDYKYNVFLLYALLLTDPARAKWFTVTLLLVWHPFISPPS